MVRAFWTPAPQYDSVGDYLLDLAKDVATWVAGKPGVMQRFREQIEVYAKAWERWTEAQAAGRENRWTPGVDPVEYPLAVFSPRYSMFDHAEKEAKQLPGFYSLVAFLHDRELPHLEKINNGIVTSAEIIQETLLAPGNEREGVNGLRSDISDMAEAYAIEECLNWVSIDLRDHFGEGNAGDAQTAAENEQRAKAMSDADLFQHLAQMFELCPLMKLLKDRTWRDVDRAVSPWFGEAVRRLKVTREKEVGLLEYRYQCLIGSVKNTQTRKIRGRAACSSSKPPVAYGGELADSFARLALEAGRASELERGQKPTLDDKVARLIQKLEEVKRRKKNYQLQYPHSWGLGVPSARADSYWEEWVQPWIDDAELDLVEVDAAVRGYWPSASPTWEEALAIVRRGREPDSMHSVVQGFRILGRKMAEQAKEQIASPPDEPGFDRGPGMDIPTIEEISEVIQKYEDLEREIERLKDVAENGEDPEAAKAEGQKAEAVFRELRDTLATGRPFPVTGIPAGIQARIDALRDGGEFSGWSEAHMVAMRGIGQSYRDLPISILRRLQTEVIPMIWPGNSQEVKAGMTVGNLKDAVALVEKSKELELTSQVFAEMERVLQEVDLILCPYQEFLRRETDGGSVPAGESRRRMFHDAALHKELGEGSAQPTDTFSFGATIHWYKRIKRRLEVRAQRQQQAELPQETPERVERPTTKRRVKAAQSPVSRKFQPWPKPGDACFIIDGDRILFHRDGEIKDLRLKSHSSTQDLLIALQGGVLQSHDIKTRFCKGTTKPIQVVSRANERLNVSIKQVGFTCLPDCDVDFLPYARAFDHYASVLPIHASKSDFERAQAGDEDA